MNVKSTDFVVIFIQKKKELHTEPNKTTQPKTDE